MPLRSHSADASGTDDPPLRVGMVGYGLAGSIFHAPLLAALPELQLAVVVTGNAERADQARHDHQGVRVVDRAERLWELADQLDLVVIASPNRTHVPLARAALEAGLPVVVDKPLAATAAEAEALVEEAERRGLMLTVFQNRRWDGDILTVQQLVREGALGRVLRFESRFERWRPTPKPGWRQLGDPEEAGGLLYDLGAHLIDQALQLFGPVERVYAEVERRRPGVEVDDDTFVALAHRSGVRSHLWMSTNAAQLGPRLRVLGDRAAYTKYGLDVQEAALHAGGTPDQPGWGEEPSDRWGSLGAAEETHPVRTLPGGYHRFYQGVASTLREGAPVPVDPRDAVAALRIIEAAQQSATDQRVVAVTT